MHFTKLHGLGNDFVTFDNRDGAIAEEKKNALAARLCHRRTGVGGDGLILVENSEPCDTRMLHFQQRRQRGRDVRKRRKVLRQICV